MSQPRRGNAGGTAAGRRNRRAQPTDNLPADIEPQAASAVPAAPPVPTPDLQQAIRVLENRLAAQAWDIKGLTGQRDEAYETVTALRSELVALREELLTLSRARAHDITAYHRYRHDLDAGYALARGLRREAMRSLAAIIARAPRGADAHAFEAMLIRASGLFDEVFYRAQRADEPAADEDAVLHYVTLGERAGRPPNRLFRSDLYADSARAAGMPTEDMAFETVLAHYITVGVPNHIPANYLLDRAFCLAQTDEADDDEFDPLLFYLRVGRARGASPHPLFDIDYYRHKRGPALAPDGDPLADYLDNAARLDFTPHPLVHAGYYFESYPDIRDAGADPFLHYVQYGDYEGRQPNPLFDPAYYRERNRAQMAGDGLALAHYVTQGREQGLSTHVLFDAGHYHRCYPDVRSAGIEPLQHFLENGCYERRAPHPLFDTKYLLDHAPEITKHHPNAVIAFMESTQRHTASPTPFFDVRYYVAHHPEAAEYDDGPFMHYLRIGRREGFDPHPLFMSRYYLERRAEAGFDEPVEDPLTHYLLTDPRQTVSPLPLFDQDYYFEHYPDVAAGGGNPLVHFLTSGGLLNEKRQPHVLFDVNFYAREYRDDLRPGTNLLLDFLENGLARGRQPHRLFDPAYYLGQDVDDPLLHENALIDYLLKGRTAKRNPHPLFDHAFYEANVEIPEGWTKTLLEHYCTYALRVQLLPHPSMDTPSVLERLPHVADLGVNLLEFFLQRAVSESVDPHPIFDTRSYLIRHPEAATSRMNPLAHHVMRGGIAWWKGEAQDPRPAVSTTASGRRGKRAAAPAMLPAIELAPVRGLQLSAAFRAHLETSEYQAFGADPAERRPDRIALYAAYLPDGVVPPAQAATLAALAAAGYFVVLVNSTLANGEALRSTAKGLADLLITRSPGGRDIASWVLTAVLLHNTLVAAEHVLFMNDSFVGPFDDLAPVWDSLAASTSPWWGATESAEGDYHVQTALFALKREALQSEAFERYITQFRFPMRRYDIQQEGEIGLSRAMLEGGFRPSVLAPVDGLRARWLDAVPTNLAWFEALPDRVDELHLRGQMDEAVARGLSKYARDWYLDMTSMLSLGDQINPTLLLWEGLLEKHRFPFIKRDLVLFNPPKTPEIVRLRLLAGNAWPRLAELLAPILPYYPQEISPVLRMTREYLQD